MNTPASPDFDGALLPCPFCGGKPRSWEDCDMGYSRYGRFWFNVMCDACGFFMRDKEEFKHTEDGRYVLQHPEKECFTRWNTRADACRVEVVTVEEAIIKLNNYLPWSYNDAITREVLDAFVPAFSNGVIVKENGNGKA